MFRKILVANRGEIAVRIIRACRDLGIETVAVYSDTERESLHVRMADECRPVLSAQRYGDLQEILSIAEAVGADAIHPGYGFLAEQPEFARACAEAGVAAIGPPADVIELLRDKIRSMDTVRAAGFDVPVYSGSGASADEFESLKALAEEIGYPLVLKACRGGRGRGSRVVGSAERLPRMAAVAHGEARRIFGEDRLFVEKVVAPSHYVAVQILGDEQGNIVHLGEREGSILWHNQKLVEESPAPCLTPDQRRRLWAAAVEIATLFGYRNAGAVEFLVDGEGRFYFTEIKARIQIEHAVSEMVSGVDIVQEQIRIAAGQPLRFEQKDVRLTGNAMMARINAEDPWNDFLPSPGQLERFRVPGGSGVRVESYGFAGCPVPLRYDPLLANVIAHAEDRHACITRLRRALQEFKIVGVQTTLPIYPQILTDPTFVEARYNTGYMLRRRLGSAPMSEETRRNLAAAAAVAFLLRMERGGATLPERFAGGWHRASRRLPV